MKQIRIMGIVTLQQQLYSGVMIDLLADVRAAAALNVFVEGLVTSLRAGAVIGALPRVMVDVDDDMVKVTVVADVMSIALEFPVLVSYVVDAVADVMI